MTSPNRLLRAFPPAWRERYGDELEALIEDTLEGHRPTLGFQLSIVWSGLGERALGFGLTGDARSREDCARAGGLLVGCAWCAFVVAGLALAERTEHSGARPLVEVITVLAIVAAAACVLGLLVAGPSIARFLRGSGWEAAAKAVRRSVGASLLALAATTGLVLLARSVPAAERDAGSFRYDLAFVGWAAVVVVALVSWTAVAVHVGRRVPLPWRVLTVEAISAVVVAMAMVAMTCTTIRWWQALGPVAPGQIGVIVATMLVADAVAGWGIAVISRAR